MNISELVIATRNRGKLREFRQLLANTGSKILGLEDLGIGEDFEETGSSFVENARLKARNYSLLTDIPVLGDDSGLEVVALGGRPAYEGPLDSFLWPLDIGIHRFYTDQPPSQDGGPPPKEFSPSDMVLVEVTPADVSPGSNYRTGFYSSPYSPKAVVARLGPPYQEGREVGSANAAATTRR